MTEYIVTFMTKISAKSDKDLSRKAEQVSDAMTKCLKKRVTPHGFLEIEKKDVPAIKNTDVQTTL